jgi:hypothetical protein
MVYGLVMLLLFLAWKWRLRDLLKRMLIIASIPFTHLYFLNRAENPLVFQAWTLFFLLVLLMLLVYRIVRWLRGWRK